jgi:hypothetical protein
LYLSFVCETFAFLLAAGAVLFIYSLGNENERANKIIVKLICVFLITLFAAHHSKPFWKHQLASLYSPKIQAQIVTSSLLKQANILFAENGKTRASLYLQHSLVQSTPDKAAAFQNLAILYSTLFLHCQLILAYGTS